MPLHKQLDIKARVSSNPPNSIGHLGFSPFSPRSIKIEEFSRNPAPSHVASQKTYVYLGNLCF